MPDTPKPKKYSAMGLPPKPVRSSNTNKESLRSILRETRSSVRPPATQLYSISSAAQLAAGLSSATAGMFGNDAAMLELKLRRRHAHEWEFLATVLDRLLLIVFAGLVVLVTAAMLVIGELIHVVYRWEEEKDGQTTASEPVIFEPAPLPESEMGML